MAKNEGFDGELVTSGSFSQLLNPSDFVSLDNGERYIYPSSFSSGKMLCFGDEARRVSGQLSGVTTGSDSSSASSSNNSSSNSFAKFSTKSRSGEPKTEQRKRNGSGPLSVPESSSSGPVLDRGETCKRSKTENPTSTSGTVKVRKEKLGDRITALQQLVSPFGKTDTASVLHEAMGYIRFLHDQVQVLSSPYLQRLSSCGGENEDDDDEESKYDLRSRGLCLVPVAYTVHVANSNGADFWSPAMGNNNSNSKN